MRLRFLPDRLVFTVMPALCQLGGESSFSSLRRDTDVKVIGVNLETYLGDTLAKVANDHPISRIGELMPWNSGSH